MVEDPPHSGEEYIYIEEEGEDKDAVDMDADAGRL